jgi:thiamine-monophosphate kinase
MKVANSLIDVSDGVAADLGHICTESKLGAIIAEKMIPTTKQFRAYCEKFQEDSRHLSLHVGEDYVLLGTVPVESAARLQEALESNGCQFHSIGKTVAESGLRLEGRDGSVEVIGANGWDHFR